MKPEIIIPVIAAALLFLLSVLCVIRAWMVGKTRFICSHCGYRFRIRWYKRPFTRLQGKETALLTCPVCRTHGLFGREKETT